MTLYLRYGIFTLHNFYPPDSSFCFTIQVPWRGVYCGALSAQKRHLNTLFCWMPARAVLYLSRTAVKTDPVATRNNCCWFLKSRCIFRQIWWQRKRNGLGCWRSGEHLTGPRHWKQYHGIVYIRSWATCGNVQWRRIGRHAERSFAAFIVLGSDCDPLIVDGVGPIICTALVVASDLIGVTTYTGNVFSKIKAKICSAKKCRQW